MKKLVILLSSLLLVFSLAGCKDASAKVSNPNEVLVTVGNKKITKETVYEVLRDGDGGETAVNLATKYICDKEVEATDKMNEEVDKQVKSLKDSLKDSFEQYLTYIGCKDEDELRDSLLADLKQKELANKYIEENWDEVIEYYYPRLVRIIETTSSDAANEAIREIQSGKDFGKVAQEYSTKSATIYDGSEQIITRDTELPSLVVSFLRNSTNPTLSGIIQNDNLDRFYVVQITNCNPAQFKDKATEAIAASTTLKSDALAFYYKKYNFKCYDISLYNIMKEDYPTYLNQ